MRGGCWGEHFGDGERGVWGCGGAGTEDLGEVFDEGGDEGAGDVEGWGEDYADCEGALCISLTDIVRDAMGGEGGDLPFRTFILLMSA